jgi:outer membrane lipoprotein-sorting protein
MAAIEAPNSNFQAPEKLQAPSFNSAVRRSFVGIFCLVLGLGSFGARAADTNSVLSAWLDAQTNIQTWSADFTQTRVLKSLTQPLTASGHVWFEAPNRFRWELGNPPQTIAVRGPEEMLVIYPRLKHAERYPLAGDQSGQWREVMKLLEAGFPRSQAEMEAQYNILAQHIADDVCELTLQPKSALARKMMPQIKIGFSTKDFSLRSTELQFADESIMRNDFKNPELNPKLDDSLFTPKLDADYKISEPFSNK